MQKAANVYQRKSVYCFTKASRLASKSDYEHVFAHSKKQVTTDFVFLYCENALGQPRLGLAISKKVIAKAHDRNRIKRLVRETFRLKTLPAMDIIILARKGVGSVHSPSIIRELNKTWDKLCGD